MIIQISAEIRRDIHRHGKTSYPEECCGMILGTHRGGMQIVDAVVRTSNSHSDNRTRRFLISPQQYRRAELIASERGLELLGLYHSHPDTPAIPSSSDIQNALPGFTYLIVSIAKGRPRGMTAWLLNENRSRFVERPIAGA